MGDQPKWTNGPWPAKMTGDGKRIVIGDGLVEGPGGYEVAEVYSDDCDRAEAWANAHLISAAPDLYAALDAAMAFIESHVADPDITDEMIRNYGALQDLRPHDALAKARGQA